MNNKDMPGGMRIRIALDREQLDAVLMALRVAQSHVIFNEDRKAMRELAKDIKSTVEAALLNHRNQFKESDPFPDCTMECGGLSSWCKCRSDAAALAELEKRS